MALDLELETGKKIPFLQQSINGDWSTPMFFFLILISTFKVCPQQCNIEPLKIYIVIEGLFKIWLEPLKIYVVIALDHQKKYACTVPEVGRSYLHRLASGPVQACLLGYSVTK